MSRRVGVQVHAGRIRVLHLLPWMRSGGVEIRRKILLKYDRSERFEHHFCSLDMNESYGCEIPALGGTTHFAPEGSTWSPLDVRGLWSVGRLVDELRPDIVHGAVFEGMTATAVGGYLGTLRRLMLSRDRYRPGLIVEETSCPRNRSWRGKLLQELIVSVTDRCVAVSPAVKLWLCRNIRASHRKVVVVYNAVELDEGVYVGGARDAMMKELSLHEDDFVIGSIGRFNDDIKKFSSLIVRFPSVVEQVPHAKLLIIGQGKDFEKCQKLAEETGMGDRILLPGHRHDARRYCPLMDVFAMASREESFGLVFAEAMAAGVPVVAPRVGGVPWVVRHGETGLITPACDDDALVRGVVKLALDSELRSTLGRRGRRWARTMFSPERYVADLHRLYDTVLSGRRAISVT